MEYRLTGERLVIGEQPPTRGQSFDTDLKASRNDRMIQTLLQPDINGMFLFYLQKNQEFLGSGFLMPPGLSEKDSDAFQKKFLALFEYYASRAKK